jgi:hypothetical protein
LPSAVVPHVVRDTFHALSSVLRQNKEVPVNPLGFDEVPSIPMVKQIKIKTNANDDDYVII